MSTFDQAAAERHWFDLHYWLGAYPDVRLNPADNAHVAPRALRVPWTNLSTPPIVAVQFTPQGMQRPSGPMDSSWMGLVSAGVGAFIPGGGIILKGALTAAKIGVGVAQSLALQDWAKNSQVSPDVFSPQYSPAPFLIPMPLDRAWLMVRHPWYAPAMVYQFQQELVNSALRPNAAAAYAAILQAMLPAGTVDPPASTAGEATLFSFADQSVVNGQLSVAPITPSVVNGQLSVATTNAPITTDHGPRTTDANQLSGGTTLAVVAGLALLGAPILLVGAVALALISLGKSTNH